MYNYYMYKKMKASTKTAPFIPKCWWYDEFFEKIKDVRRIHSKFEKKREFQYIIYEIEHMII